MQPSRRKIGHESLLAQTNGGGHASIGSGSGSYSDDTDLWIVVEKTCGTSVIENVSYTVTGHF